jgi:putative membrane protein
MEVWAMEPIDFLIAWLVTGSSLLLISQLPIGVEIDSTPKAVFAAAILGILNVLILPILKAVFFVPNVLTLGLLSGLFAFVMNVIIFATAAKLVEGFSLRMGIWSAVLGALALALVSSLINGVLI